MEATGAAVRVVFGDEVEDAIVAALASEEARERATDETYWRPLLIELEALRHEARRAQSEAPIDESFRREP